MDKAEYVFLKLSQQMKDLIYKNDSGGFTNTTIAKTPTPQGDRFYSAKSTSNQKLPDALQNTRDMNMTDIREKGLQSSPDSIPTPKVQDKWGLK